MRKFLPVPKELALAALLVLWGCSGLTGLRDSLGMRPPYDLHSREVSLNKEYPEFPHYPDSHVVLVYDNFSSIHRSFMHIGHIWFTEHPGQDHSDALISLKNLARAYGADALANLRYEGTYDSNGYDRGEVDLVRFK